MSRAQAGHTPPEPAWSPSPTNSAAGSIFLLLAVLAPLAPFTGLLVERLPGRQILIANDLLTAALVLALLAVRDRGDVWIVYVVTVGYGLSSQVYRAARGGFIHSMLPAELLGDANGLLSALGQGPRIVGPIVGPGLFVLAGGGAVAVLDAVTFLVSAGCFSALRGVPDLDRTKPETPHHHSARAPVELAEQQLRDGGQRPLRRRHDARHPGHGALGEEVRGRVAVAGPAGVRHRVPGRGHGVAPTEPDRTRSYQQGNRTRWADSTPRRRGTCPA